MKKSIYIWLYKMCSQTIRKIKNKILSSELRQNWISVILCLFQKGSRKLFYTPNRRASRVSGHYLTVYWWSRFRCFCEVDFGISVYFNKCSKKKIAKFLETPKSMLIFLSQYFRYPISIKKKTSMEKLLFGFSGN